MRWTRIARGAAMAAALLLGACDEPVDEDPIDSGLPTADEGVEPDEGADPDDGVLPDEGLEPDGALPPDAELADPRPSSVEVCTGCGTSRSGRFLLLDHAVAPIAAPAEHTATSARYRLVVGPE